MIYTGRGKEMADHKVKVQFTLKLYEDDLKDILYRMAADGTNLTEILESFISDLICGKSSRGSDECSLARRYYDRCCYGMGADDTFLRYLLKSSEIEYYLDIMSDIEAYSEWLSSGEDYSEELKEAKQEQDSIYKQWAERYEKPPQSRKKAYKQVEKWHEKYEKFMDQCERISKSEGVEV